MTTKVAELEEHLLAGMEKLGYPRTGGPEDASVVDRVVLVLTGVGADRDDLRRQLADVEGKLAEAGERIVVVVGERDEFENQLAAARTALVEAQAETDGVVSQRDELLKDKGALTTSLAAIEARVAELAQAASVTAAARGPELRVTRPIEGDRDLGPKAVEALLTRLRTEPHTIVFSDGAREIAALEPIRVSAGAWQQISGGVLMIERVEVKPNAPVALAGFALFDPDGVQIGWCPMSSPLGINAGATVRLDRQIVFAPAAADPDA